MSEVALNPGMLGEFRQPQTEQTEVKTKTETAIIGSHKKWLDRLRFTIEASVLAGVVAIGTGGIAHGAIEMNKDHQAAEQAERDNRPADQSQEAHDRNMRQLGEIGAGIAFGIVALCSVKHVKAPL